MIISPEDLARMIARFQLILPLNPANGEKFSVSDISRVTLKHCTRRIYSPAVESDKHDLLFLLRQQYYNDIKLAANSKAAIVKESNKNLRLI